MPRGINVDYSRRCVMDGTGRGEPGPVGSSAQRIQIEFTWWVNPDSAPIARRRDGAL
jgi:hypothetical protein